jgi:hypothetical protein
MTVLLRSIRPSVYNIHKFCGYERCNVNFDGLMELHLAADSMSTTVTTRDYVLSFSGIISLQQSPQNVSWFHTRF